MMNPNDPFNQYNQPYPNYLNASPMYRQRRPRTGGCGVFGCLTTILILAILLAGYFYYSNHVLPHIPSFITTLLIVMAIPVALIVFIVLFIRNRARGKGFMSSVVGALFILAVFGGLIAFAIYSTRITFPEVDLTPTAFVQNSVDADVGAHVHFVNPSNGVEQILCVGSNGHCAAAGGEPAELDGQGLRIEPGQTITLVFNSSGDYQITSKSTPGMNMIIHVIDNSSGGD